MAEESLKVVFVLELKLCARSPLVSFFLHVYSFATTAVVSIITILRY